MAGHVIPTEPTSPNMNRSQQINSTRTCITPASLPFSLLNPGPLRITRCLPVLPCPGGNATMHFALPPRKTSFPPPYARVSAQNASSQRRRLFTSLASFLAGLVTIYLIFSISYLGDTSVSDGAIKKDASVVIVTVLDDSLSEEYVSLIKKNRDDYASRHGEQLQPI